MCGGGRGAGNEDRYRQEVSSSNPFSAAIRYVPDEKNEQSNRHFRSNQRLVVLNEFVVEELHGLWGSSSPTRGRT